MKNTLLSRAIWFMISSLLLVLPGAGIAQKYFTAEKSYAVKLGRTKPLYDLMVMDPTDSLKLKIRKANKPKFVPNFAGRRHLDVHSPTALPKGPDPLYNENHFRSVETEVLPKVNIEGIPEASANSGVPDVNGDIGRDYYVEVVNATYFKVYDKNGQAVSGLISANTIWSQVQQSSAGDPILLYDQEVDRWFLTEFPSNNRVLIAISLTSDPRGSWDVYSFQTPQFPDFPKYGIWPDAYYLTTNENGANYPIYAFNREDILAGAAVVRFQRLTAPKNFGVFFEIGQPVDWDGMTPPPQGSPGIVVKLHDDDWQTTDHDHIVLHKIHIDWNNSSNSNIELIDIPTAPFDTDGCSLETTGGFSCIPQPNQQGIDGAEWIITNKAQYRNFGTHEAFVLSFMVDVTGEEVAGIRWMEFRKTTVQDWHLYQEGTIGSDDGIHRFMSSIGIDGQGNIGIAYSVSGYDKHPSLRFTGRYASDPPGTMTFKEYEFATGAGSLGFDRFGDYASMSVDPADDQTFWFAGEYIPTNGSWSTRIVAFSAARDTIDIFPVSLIAPKSSAELGIDEPLTISVLNRGLSTVYDFSVAFQYQGGTWVEEQALADSLQVDSTYIHTFQQGLDFDHPGNYSLRIATILNEDRNHRNDTLTFILSKPAFRDIALGYNVNSEQPVICADNNDNSIDIRNLGVETVTSILFQLLRNGVPVDTILWNGSLPYGQEEIFYIPTSGLTEGDNEITLNVLEVNGDTDELPLNNEITWNLVAKPEGFGIFLNLTTDNFPQETTWELVDSANQVIATGGPYAEQQTLYISSFCVDPDACYTFIIYDAFGDGMSAQGVKGDYDILTDEGEIIASLSQANFGDSDANQFCLSGECGLTLNVGVEQESSPGAGDAWVIGDVTNSLGTIAYSIDGQNYQPTNTFTNLDPGEYMMIAIDEAGCSDTSLFTVVMCQLQTLVTTFPASGGDVGQIHVNATGGIGNIVYSLNGGAFIPDSFFVMLEPGDYYVTTRDSAGCESLDSVTVSTQVSTTILKDDHFIQLNPNPGKGIYQVNARFQTTDIFVHYMVCTSDGEPVVRGTLGRYDDNYKGELSLVAYPAGTYFVLFYVNDHLAVRRVVKLE